MRWIVELENELPSDKRNAVKYELPSVNFLDEEKMDMKYRRIIIMGKEIIW